MCPTPEDFLADVTGVLLSVLEHVHPDNVVVQLLLSHRSEGTACGMLWTTQGRNLMYILCMSAKLSQTWEHCRTAVKIADKAFCMVLS